MSLYIFQAGAVTGEHLDPRDVVAYVDHVATPSERLRIETHLARCALCRDEVTEAAQIIATRPRVPTRRGQVTIAAAGIAAMLLVFLWPRADRQPATQQHREAPITTTVAPVILAPAGEVQSANVFTWSSVPHADLYELRVFDADGGVVWESATRDTLAALPLNIALHAKASYYWKVQADVGFDRSSSTDLVEFSVNAASRK
jgi:hypothetical protein